MAAKPAKKKAAKPAKKASPKPAKRPAVTKKSAPKSAKIAKASARSTPSKRPPSGKPEPPPIDHNAALGPLYLGAGVGHLARSVDKSWMEAIRRYRETLDKAVAYEDKRSAPARATFAITFARQLQTLMNNLATRVSAIIHDINQPELDAAHKAQARSGGKLLVAELQDLNKTLGDMAGPSGIAPHGDASLPLGQPALLEQLQRSYFNNIARWADLDRALS